MIQLPFVLEGVIAAFTGALLAALSLAAVVEFFIQDWFGATWVKIVNMHDVLLVAPVLLISAVLIASVTSFVALRRYTQV